jgi:hypothetical protein
VNLRDDDKYLAEYLKVAKKQIESGHKELVLRAMHECLIMNKPLPEWLRWAFIQAYQSAYPFETKSWHDGFGTPHPKGVHLEARKKQFELSFPIWSRVQDLKASGEKIDKGLFEKIGKEFGVSGTTASTIYYDDRTQLDFSILISARKRKASPTSTETRTRSKVPVRRKSPPKAKPRQNSKKR